MQPTISLNAFMMLYYLYNNVSDNHQYTITWSRNTPDQDFISCTTRNIQTRTNLEIFISQIESESNSKPKTVGHRSCHVANLVLKLEWKVITKYIYGPPNSRFGGLKPQTLKLTKCGLEVLLQLTFNSINVFQIGFSNVTAH